MRTPIFQDSVCHSRKTMRTFAGGQGTRTLTLRHAAKANYGQDNITRYVRYLEVGEPPMPGKHLQRLSASICGVHIGNVKHPFTAPVRFPVPADASSPSEWLPTLRWTILPPRLSRSPLPLAECIRGILAFAEADTTCIGGNGSPRTLFK